MNKMRIFQNTAAVVIPVAIGLMAYGCSAKVEVKSSPTVAASAPDVVASAPDPEPPIPMDDKLAAILRVSERLTTVCFNGFVDGKETFFLKYKPAEGDSFGDGWVYIDDQTFLHTVVGKIYTQAPNREHYNATYPDVTGLQCKQQ